VFDEAPAGVGALRAACAEVASLHAEDYTPCLRAGLHIGRPRRLGGDYLGVDVNIAARVAAAARGGEVLVSGAGCERLDDQAFRLQRRRFRAKGAPRELTVYAVEPAAGLD
jgi:adenylate cyclase